MRNEFWFISTLISVGVIGGFLYNWPTSSNSGADRQLPDSKVAAILTEANLSAADVEEFNKQLSNHLRRGDNFLEVGNFDGAFEQYQSARDIKTKRLSNKTAGARLLFRLGLASEMNLQFDKAEFFYRQAISQRHSDPYRKMMLELAQTRNWGKQGRNSNALDLLSRMYLAEEGGEQFSEKLKFEVGKQLLEIAEKRAQELYSSKLSIFQSPIFEICPTNISESLQMIDAERAEQAVERTLATDDLEVLQNPNDNAELIILRGSSKSKAVSKLLVQIGGKTELQFQYGVGTQPYLVGRTVKFNSDAISLAVLLDVMLHPLNLVWRQTATNIEIVPAASISRQELGRFRGAQAVRIGRHLIVNYPENECRNSMRLAIANLHILLGEFDDGSTMLNQMLDEKINGELKAKVHLSLGIVENRFQRYDNAVEQFLLAIDQTLNTDIQAIAYANIARVQIEQNFIDPAIIASRRSLSLTTNADIRSAAALDMARGYLIKRDLQSANRVLFEQRDAIVDGVERKLATLFGAYARSLATLSPINKQRATETLVIALADIQSSDLTQTIDRIIVSNAYLSIGLPDRAVDALVITNANPENEFWNRRRTFELARLLMLNGSVQAAVSNYDKLARDISDQIGQRALLQLAEFQLLKAKAPEKAVSLLRQLWDKELVENDSQQPIGEPVLVEALRIMGNAYRELGDLESAVYCFSGALPNPDTTNKSSEK